jgi:uncharacterized protein YdhG (YjbR/CyaY superfamily)
MSVEQTLAARGPANIPQVSSAYYYLPMKKSVSSAHSSSSKARAVDEYLATIPEPARSTLNKVRATIRTVVPAETEEVISYGMPAFKHKKVLVWYAAFSEHCSLFPTPSVIEQFKTDLKGYKIAKGTIQFPIDKPLPASLLNKIVKARLAQVEKKR